MIKDFSSSSQIWVIWLICLIAKTKTLHLDYDLNIQLNLLKLFMQKDDKSNKLTINVALMHFLTIKFQQILYVRDKIYAKYFQRSLSLDQHYHYPANSSMPLSLYYHDPSRVVFF